MKNLFPKKSDCNFEQPYEYVRWEGFVDFLAGERARRQKIQMRGGRFGKFKLHEHHMGINISTYDEMTSLEMSDHSRAVKADRPVCNM